MEFSGFGCRFYGGDLAKAMTSMGDGVLLQDYGESRSPGIEVYWGRGGGVGFKILPITRIW